MRTVTTMHNYSGSESHGLRSLDRLGLPLFDVFTARSPEREIGYLIAGDREQILGPALHKGAYENAKAPREGTATVPLFVDSEVLRQIRQHARPIARRKSAAS